MDVPKNYAKEIAHIGLLAAANLTKDKYLPNENIDDILNEWNTLAIEAYTNTIELKPHAKELLKSLFNNNIKVALATANSSDLYLPCIKRLDIEKYFSYIIDVNSCSTGKDTPEIYDKVSSFFNIDKKNTLVIEDSLTAIKTAFINGYNVVSIYDKNSSKKLEEIKDNSHLFIYSFKELLNLFGNID
jgi:HAD superfamily hydrolase (TIGR01509 family)